MDKTTYDKHVQEAQVSADVRIDPPKLILFPFFDVVEKISMLSTAFMTQVHDADGSHAVVLRYCEIDGVPDWFVWCGDKFLEGRDLDQDKARERCNEAVVSRPNKTRVVSEMMANYGKTPESGDCGFWANWRKQKTLCVHTISFLAHLRDTMPDFNDQLLSTYQDAIAGMVAEAETMTIDELAFRVPILFEGDRGAGKTVTARTFARQNNYKRVEFGGHEGIESPDMLGFLVPFDKSRMVWKDGPLSEAFRSARKQKTVLIIDELLRIPQRELSILLTAFSPDEGVYRLRTGRIVAVEDGVAIEEELECPVSNLCVVATTNVGAEYAVDEIDPALAERFVIIRKDTTTAELKRILTLVSDSLGVDPAAVDMAVLFFQKMTESRNRGMVKHGATTRTLVRAFELSANKGGDIEQVKRGVRSQILLWVARTGEGYPVPEQVEDVKKVIELCFKP